MIEIQTHNVPIKCWTEGVPVEQKALHQLRNTAELPIIFKHIAVMPDVHVGKGSIIGSVIPTLKAIIPAAVGVDIGCGMVACKTSLIANDLPDNLEPLRSAIERAVPHGRTRGARDNGSWGSTPTDVLAAWGKLEPDFTELCKDYKKLEKTNTHSQLGTLGGGNHFIEVCLDEENFVWFMLHSGSRGIGSHIGNMFIELAKNDARENNVHLPDMDLAYLSEGSKNFTDYVRAVHWAQQFAHLNREVMLKRTIEATQKTLYKKFEHNIEAINCHHNYVQIERHFNEDVFITRKGAVSAKKGELGIIPSSMGTKSFIVQGKGNEESFHSCAHGAGRLMSRTEAKLRFTLAEQRLATEGVECRKDKDVIDEIPMAYKDIDAVMAAQTDLVQVLHTLKQVLCIKG